MARISKRKWLFLSLPIYLSNIMVSTTQTLAQIKLQEFIVHIKEHFMKKKSLLTCHQQHTMTSSYLRSSEPIFLWFISKVRFIKYVFLMFYKSSLKYSNILPKDHTHTHTHTHTHIEYTVSIFILANGTLLPFARVSSPDPLPQKHRPKHGMSTDPSAPPPPPSALFLPDYVMS